jgi:peroxiredoxin
MRRIIKIVAFVLLMSIQVNSQPAYILKAMNVKLETLQQKTFRLADLDKEKLVVLVFLSPECPLCQYYSKVLNDLQTRYLNDIAVVGVFPGRAYKQSELVQFREKYKINFFLCLDANMVLVKQLHASVTPEVFLISKIGQQLYSGAIDDYAVSIDKRRLKPMNNYLQQAIVASLNNENVFTPQTKPVGCLINDF